MPIGTNINQPVLLGVENTPLIANHEQREHFGEHMTIDGYGGSQAKLDHSSHILQGLSLLVDRLGMKPLAEPVIYYAKGNDKKDPGGWTGILAIEESHISIHTFPAIGFVTADVYTCRNGMAQREIVDFFREHFSLKEIEVNFLRRGMHFMALAMSRSSLDAQKQKVAANAQP
ncbi:S-adenosylmethionine decarboxylase [Achromobacter seleniivolatilans]|uniref:S-adenosylmethionine decarboxylase n=1 Tax=Achromobacter seleniivolatilans TaxID=3047478 RepID=A0ABY9LU87_9BURK|nr:S-adenosylmethionine decarboxylase [Achromobacter sp. R39]WMD18322.1 S-adenosylmethionine decarboxylase [Achromobacter sp. R39]